MKWLKGWRTVLFNALAFVLWLFTLPEFLAVIPPEYRDYIGLAVILGNVSLRYLTTTPIGVKA